MVERQLPQEKEANKTLDPEILTPWQNKRAKEIRARLSWLINEGKLNQENLKGRIIDLGTGSGAGLVALRALGATQAIGVEDGSGARQACGKILSLVFTKVSERSEKPINGLSSLFEAFCPSEDLQKQEKIFLNISNEEFLKIVKEGGWGVGLVTCFWISYDPPIKQIEEVLIPGGQIVITAVKDSSRLKEIARKTDLETQVIEIPEILVDPEINDKFVLIGTKREGEGSF